MRAPSFLGLWDDKDPEGSSQTKLAPIKWPVPHKGKNRHVWAIRENNERGRTGAAVTHQALPGIFITETSCPILRFRMSPNASPPNNKTNNIQRHPGISMTAYSH